MEIRATEELRAKMQIGDRLRLRIPVKAADAVFTEKEAGVKVVGIYPRLVQVRQEQDGDWPVRTISYAEMLMRENQYMLKPCARLKKAVWG